VGKKILAPSAEVQEKGRLIANACGKLKTRSAGGAVEFAA
jgi:hypothetical protein